MNNAGIVGANGCSEWMSKADYEVNIISSIMLVHMKKKNLQKYEERRGGLMEK